MKRDLATIDAVGLIYENLKLVVKCITLEDVDREETRLLAYIADDYLDDMWATVSSLKRIE
ncbi:MAG: hypothetical protein FWD06_00030 [Oscillospiraceae bacterium]|nr:hypothetical protein [Oscillospiraceae bacterium]